MEPSRSRYRLTFVRAVACVLVLLLVGCSGKGGTPGAGSALPVGPLPSGAPAIQEPQGTCTEVDLNGPVLTMPEPQKVTSPIIIDTGIVARLDPLPGAKAHFSAEDAWKRFTFQNPLHARSAKLLLGTFSAHIPFGPKGPEDVRALSWVLRVHHLAYAQPVGNSSDNGSGSAGPSAVCEFIDAILVIDATTGAILVYSY